MATRSSCQQKVYSREILKALSSFASLYTTSVPPLPRHRSSPSRSSRSLLQTWWGCVAWHNHLRDIFANFCHCGHLSLRVEVGYCISRDHVNSHTADVLVQDGTEEIQQPSTLRSLHKLKMSSQGWPLTLPLAYPFRTLLLWLTSMID